MIETDPDVNIIRLSEESKSNELNPDDYFTWIFRWAETILPNLFLSSMNDSRCSNDINRDYDFAKSIRTASLLQDYRYVITLSNLLSGNDFDKKNLDEKNSGVVLSASEVGIKQKLGTPFNFTEDADQFVRTIEISGKMLHSKGDSRSSDFKSFKAYKMASLVQNYSSICALNNFYGTNHPYAAMDLTANLEEVEGGNMVNLASVQPGGRRALDPLYVVVRGQPLLERQSANAESTEAYNDGMDVSLKNCETTPSSGCNTLPEDFRDDVEDYAISSDKRVRTGKAKGKKKSSYTPPNLESSALFIG
jgi:hypothetical protein